MRIRELNKDEARKIYNDIILGGASVDYTILDSDYSQLRKKLLKAEASVAANEKGYKFDLEFGIQVYKIFNALEDFNETVASNYDFWRYICLAVVPDIINRRHKDQKEYYYDKNVRIYLSTLWWYIHIGFYKDEKTTFDMLKEFNTDYILQFVERPGREGLYLDVLRNIIRGLSQIKSKDRNAIVGNKTLLRRVLMLHTAQSLNYNPVVENDVKNYVEELFDKCGVRVKL